ncbi:MAG: hypothetical protein HYY05_02315 [Chloroflexi bacterium]|nr:hypothetical protein [Chloroflexota bacterium]
MTEEAGLPVGAAAPAFALPSTEGGQVTLAEALADGPLVLQFSRPDW